MRMPDQPRRLLGWALDCLDFEAGLDCGGFAAEGGLGCCTSDEGSERGTSVWTSQPGGGERMRLRVGTSQPGGWMRSAAMAGVRPRRQPGGSRSPAPPRAAWALLEPCVKGRGKAGATFEDAAAPPVQSEVHFHAGRSLAAWQGARVGVIALGGGGGEGAGSAAESPAGRQPGQ